MTGAGGGAVAKWTYDISRHALGELLTEMEELGYAGSESASPVILCDTQGECVFDDAPDPLRETIVALLNERGSDGWELVQIIFRDQELVAFWKKELN